MKEETQGSPPSARQLWQETSRFAGSPQEFWPLLVRSATQTGGGELGVLYALSTQENGRESWTTLASWPNLDRAAVPELTMIAPGALIAEARAVGLAVGTAIGHPWLLGLLDLHIDADERELILMLYATAGNMAAEIPLRQALASYQGVPRLYEVTRRQMRSERDTARLVQTLELLGRIIESENFDRAALACVNELSACFGCETVTLSWLDKSGMRVRAISHADKIDRRTELTTLIEEAGQEALAQECEIAWPSTSKAVTQAHRQYAELQNPGHLLTLPLRTDGKLGGAITLERQRMAFTSAETWAARLMCDLAVPSLAALEASSRPLWRRLAENIWRSVPQKFKAVTEDGQRFARSLALAATVTLLFPWPYWVDAGAIVKTDAMAYVGAPYDGYLEKSFVSLGASVNAGDSLFKMQTRELELERASSLADIAQYLREAEKRRAANQLPEMQIAEAQAAQAEARLKQIEYRLASAEAKSPINGILVEGEPGKNLGGAVRRGETVVKVASLGNLYVEAAVNERDISRVATESDARLTLLADTGQTYPMRVTRIVPAASVRDGANTFPVRLELRGGAPDWWRPGMSGVSQVYVGFRPLIWIATHRLVDYLRIALWF